jgi:hypothetical protein
MFHSGENIVCNEHRLALSTAGGGTVANEIIQIDVQQEQVLISVILDLDPFAAGGALKVDVQAYAQSQPIIVEFEDRPGTAG